MMNVATNQIRKLLWKFKLSVMSFKGRRHFSKIYEEITIKDGSTLLSIYEIFNVYSAVLSVSKINGDIAEVGIYRGGSAKVIGLVENKKKIHLFDTFEGLPETSKKIDGNLKKGDYSRSLEYVQKYLDKFENIQFYKGIFPSSANKIKDKKFSFVHFDVDLYQSTKDCLEFFYPRMNKGGIILTHDYPFYHGVKKAFDEFFQNKKEPVIPLLYAQAMVVKL